MCRAGMAVARDHSCEWSRATPSSLSLARNGTFPWPGRAVRSDQTNQGADSSAGPGPVSRFWFPGAVAVRPLPRHHLDPLFPSRALPGAGFSFVSARLQVCLAAPMPGYSLRAVPLSEYTEGYPRMPRTARSTRTRATQPCLRASPAPTRPAPTRSLRKRSRGRRASSARAAAPSSSSAPPPPRRSLARRPFRPHPNPRTTGPLPRRARVGCRPCRPGRSGPRRPLLRSLPQSPCL
jgi:hypothetical protein